MSMMAAVRQVSGDLSGVESKITYVIVNKRHRTRFFCENPKEATGKAKNIPPGSTVDTTILHPDDFDFFQCPHFGIQGTSRPIHYYVVHDGMLF